MDFFLAGFSDELAKVASRYSAGSSGLKATTSTAKPGGAAKFKPSNYSKPAASMKSKVPTQELKSPGKKSPSTWRPSPGYKPRPSSSPKPKPPKPAGGGGGSGGRGKSTGVAWESVGGQIGRKLTEFASQSAMKSK